MSFQGFLRQSTAVDVKIGPFVDSTDGDAEETGLTINASDVILSKNGQTGGAKNDDTAAAHAEDGMYNCEFDATDTNTIGQLTLGVHVAGALFVRHDWQVVEEEVYDDLFVSGAVGYLKPVTAGRDLDVTTGGNAGIDWGNVANPTTTVDLSGTDIQLVDTCTTNTDVRGTNSAALASVCTETRLAELDGANMPADIDAILVDTGTTLDGKLPTTLVSGRMNSSVGAMAATVITDAATAADAFDKLFERDMDQVEASAPLHSLTTAVLKAVSRVRDNAGTLEVFRTDGTTVHMSQTVTADATLDPVDELTAGV